MTARGGRAALAALLAVVLAAPAADAAPPAPPPAPPPGSLAGTVSFVKLSVGSRVASAEAVVVYLEDAPAGAAPPGATFTISQVDKAFDPPLLVVPVGARVDFPNMDDLFHNVFSPAPGNAFDLGLYKSGASKSAVFATPGVVPIFCNIHPQMIAYLLVVTNPYNTRAHADGSYLVAGIPPGTYTAVAWFPYGHAERQKVVIAPGQVARADFRLRERASAGQHPNKEGKPYTRY